MARTTHDRTLDHRGTDLDTNVLLDGALSFPTSTASGQTVHQALSDLNGALISSGGIGDLITGASSTFAGSNGSWTVSGGTLTHDTGIHLAFLTGSLKHVTTSTNQHADLAIAGTFLAGYQYQCILLVEVNTTDTYTMTFGLIGTDSASGSFSIASTAGNFVALSILWTPSANRTGVSVRFNAAASATTYYIGWAKAFKTPVVVNLGDPAAGVVYTPLIMNNNFAALRMGARGSGISLYASGRINITSPASGVDISTNLSVNGGADGTASDLSGEGLNVEVGPDFVGLNISEKDGSTIQIYDDDGGSYNIELVDQGSFGFKTVNATYSTPLSNLHSVLTGTVDPSAGGGVAHTMPAMYLRNNANVTELWLATGTGATAWTKQTSP